MNATIRAEVAVMAVMVVPPKVVQGLVNGFISIITALSATSALVMRHLRNGSSSISAVTPDFIY